MVPLSWHTTRCSRQIRLGIEISQTHAFWHHSSTTWNWLSDQTDLQICTNLYKFQNSIICSNKMLSFSTVTFMGTGMRGMVWSWKLPCKLKMLKRRKQSYYLRHLYDWNFYCGSLGGHIRSGDLASVFQVTRKGHFDYIISLNVLPSNKTQLQVFFDDKDYPH